MRLIGCIELEEGSEPTGVCFINGFNILIVATNTAKIFFFHFELLE